MNTPPVPPAPPPSKSRNSCLKAGLIGCGVIAVLLVVAVVATFVFARPAIEAFAGQMMRTAMTAEAKQIAAAWNEKTSEKHAEEITVADLKERIPLLPNMTMTLKPKDGSPAKVLDFEGVSTDKLKLRKGDVFTLEVKNRASGAAVGDPLVFELATGEPVAK